MKINMSSTHDKIYIIYNFKEESKKMGVENARMAAEQYIKDNFPYRDENSDESPSACGFWSAKLEDLSAVYYHENEDKELFFIYEFNMKEEFEYDCWYEDGENPCPKYE